MERIKGFVMDGTQRQKKSRKQKRRITRWMVYVIVLLLSIMMMLPAGLLLSENKESFFGLVLMIISIFGFHFSAIALIVRAIKAIVKRSTAKHERLKEVSYNEINYSGDVEATRQTTSERFSYNVDDTLHLDQSAPELSWGVVVLYLLILFPVGVFFMVRKIIHERTHYYDNGIKMIIMGAVFMALTVPVILLFLITGADNTKSLIIVTMIPGVYAVFGAVSIVLGLIYKCKGKENETYMKAIVYEKITKIDTLAGIAKTSYSGAANVIQRLIDSDMLKGAYIYHKDREVIVPGISKKIAFRCKNCGGTTVLYANEKKECIYCGAEV